VDSLIIKQTTFRKENGEDLALMNPITTDDPCNCYVIEVMDYDWFDNVGCDHLRLQRLINFENDDKHALTTFASRRRKQRAHEHLW